MGTISIQTSQPIGSGNDMSVSNDPIKCFSGRVGERYSFKKKLDSQHRKTTSSESSVNEVMETIISGENDPSTQDSVGNVTDEDGLIKLLDLYSGLVSPM